MAQVWVDIAPGVLDDFSLDGTWGGTPTVSDLGGGQYAIVVDELLRTAPRSLIYNSIADISNSDQLEIYAEIKITAYNESTTVDTSTIAGPVAQQTLANATTEDDELGFKSRRASETCVLFDRVADVFSFTSGGTTGLAAVDVKHRLRMRVEAANFYGKGWTSASTEPAEYQITRARPTLATGGSGLAFYAGARYEVTALSFGTAGDVAPIDPIYPRKVTITNLKDPNAANSVIADATGVQVKLWISTDSNDPIDTGAPDVLFSGSDAADIVSGTMELLFDSNADIGASVLGVAKWSDSNETYFFPIDTIVTEDSSGP